MVESNWKDGLWNVDLQEKVIDYLGKFLKPRQLKERGDFFGQ